MGGSRPPLAPLSAIVSISPTPPPPSVSHCQHFPNPPSPLCQLVSICRTPPSLFRVIFVNIFNTTLFLNNLFFFGRKWIIWQKLIIWPDKLDKNPYFLAILGLFQWFQHYPDLRPLYHPLSAFALPPLLPSAADIICEQPLTSFIIISRQYFHSHNNPF